MRSAALFCIAVSVSVLACGPVDQTGSPEIISADGGPIEPSDGGPAAADGGAAQADAGAPADAGLPGAAANDCEGVLPSQAGRGHAENIPHASGEACWFFTGDLAGNIAAEAHSGDASGTSWTGTWHVWGANGGQRGTFPAAGDVYGQPQGFQSTRRDNAGASLVQWTADGKASRVTPLDRGGCAAQAFGSAVGGTVVLDACPGAVTATRFDPSGNPTASQRIVASGTVTGVVDAQGRTLVVVSPGSAAGLQSSSAARWYDDRLAPLTPFFAAPEGAGAANVKPLIGGGAALQLGGAWVGTAQSGRASFEAPPDWLKAHRNFDVQIVRGGKAYAFVPKSGAPARNTMDLVSASGARCGAIAFPVQGLSLSPDGTPIGSSGDGGCTATWWSALLR